METIALASKNSGLVKLDFYPAKFNSSKGVLFIGGSGDRRFDFAEIIKDLSQKLPGENFMAFSITGIETGATLPLAQQKFDLLAVLEYLKANRKLRELTLIGTSNGAYAVCEIAGNSIYASFIKHIILLDPADYYLDEVNRNDLLTWTGFDKYTPNRKTVSDLLVDLPPGFVVDVVHLTLKNFGQGKYLEAQYSDRGKSFAKGLTRLNTTMVKAFYEKLPPINKGKYQEVDGLPHGFLRDGNIELNIKKVVEILKGLL